MDQATLTILCLVLGIGSSLGFFVGRWFVEASTTAASRVNAAMDDTGDPVSPADRQFRMLRQYAVQGLAQAKISFTVSITAAVTGFAVILAGAGLAVAGFEWTQAAVPIVGGALVDSVALLFFVQDRRHQATMVGFHERLREDRKLDESLALLHDVADDELRARISAAMALNFAQVPEALETLRVADRRSGAYKPGSG